MSGPAHSGLFLYAKDLARVAGFYETVAQLSRLHANHELVVLQGQGIQLVVHAVPAPIAETIVLTSPPQRRDNTALKFFLTVPSLADAGRRAHELGGEVFAEQWPGPGFVARNAMDPEGNVFQLREASR